jgi:PDDEXK-like domain of unknown function (DUF3799)
MIIDETAEAYHARKAVSAGFLWNVAKTDGCLAEAYWRSVFNPDCPAPANSNEFDIGTATHLLVLEGSEFAARTSLIPYDTYQSKEARDLRDACYIDGRTPLRPKDYRLVCAMQEALHKSHAAELLYGDGDSLTFNEVTITGLFDGVESKSRPDRLIGGRTLIDLKTASSASPMAFERAMDRDGHHLRAAWYMDLLWANPKTNNPLTYVFVVVSKSPPYVVSVFSTGEVPDAPGWFHIQEEAIDKGRMLYRKALAMVRRARETGVWSVHGGKGENKRTVSLPPYRLNAIYAQEKAGEFDIEEAIDEIPY